VNETADFPISRAEPSGIRLGRMTSTYRHDVEDLLRGKLPRAVRQAARAASEVIIRRLDVFGRK
jgi:hypothetical protein